MVNRKCKSCYYLGYAEKRRYGWCYRLGKPRNPSQDECEDGYEPKNDRVWP